MANGRYDYESPLNAFLSRSLPAIVGGIADRQARERMALKEMEYRTARDEADKAFRIEENRKSREQNQSQFETKLSEERKRHLDSLESQGRRERMQRKREDRASDMAVISAFSDSSWSELSRLNDSYQFRTIYGEDLANALEGKAKVSYDMMESVMDPNSPAYTLLSESNRNVLSNLRKAGNEQRFFDTYDKFISNFAKNRGLDNISIMEVENAWTNIRSYNKQLIEAGQLGETPMQKKRISSLTSAIAEENAKIGKILGTGGTQGSPKNIFGTKEERNEVLLTKMINTAVTFHGKDKKYFQEGGEGAKILQDFIKENSGMQNEVEAMKKWTSFHKSRIGPAGSPKAVDKGLEALKTRSERNKIQSLKDKISKKIERRNENAVGSENWNFRESEIKQILDNNPSLKEWYNETYIGK